MWFYSIKPSIIFILFPLDICVPLVCTLFIPQNVQFFNFGQICGQRKTPTFCPDMFCYINCYPNMTAATPDSSFVIKLPMTFLDSLIKIS